MTNLFSHLEDKKQEKGHKIELSTKDQLYQRIPKDLNQDKVALFILKYYSYFQKNVINLGRLSEKTGVDIAVVNQVLIDLCICDNTVRPFLYYTPIKKGYQVST